MQTFVNTQWPRFLIINKQQNYRKQGYQERRQSDEYTRCPDDCAEFQGCTPRQTMQSPCKTWFEEYGAKQNSYTVTLQYWGRGRISPGEPHWSTGNLRLHPVHMGQNNKHCRWDEGTTNQLNTPALASYLTGAATVDWWLFLHSCD